MYGGVEKECDNAMELDSSADSRNQHSQTDSGAHDNSNCLVDVRMIDFAHSTHQGFQGDKKHNGVDDGYLFGLGNLITIFDEIQKRYTEQQGDNG